MYKFTLGLICFFVASGHAQEIIFRENGKVVKKLSLEELRKISAPLNIKVYEPHELQEVEFLASPLNPILDTVYGSRWKKVEDSLWTGIDGYESTVPIDKIIHRKAFLAFQRNDSTRFEVRGKLHAEKPAVLGPFYLIWDNVKLDSVEKNERIGWPYQIAGIDLIDIKKRFPKIVPPDSASLQVKEGFGHFRKYCLSCHSINGDGGRVGPELNYPTSVTEYFKPEWLIKWIDTPEKLRFRTTMPALTSNIKDRKAALDAIVSYLNEMKNNKISPK